MILEKLLRANWQAHERRQSMAREAERYYENDTDIKRADRGQPNKDKAPDPLRQADNRLSHRWHGLLTDQKAAYVATYPPLLDLGSKARNQQLQEALGDQWGRDFRRLAIHATNAGCAWLHVWEEGGARKYSLVDYKQIIPLYSNGLQRKLTAVLRQYEEMDEQGESWTVTEYWDDKECSAWRRKANASTPWQRNDCFELRDLTTGADLGWDNVYPHGMGEVPFIPFPNNLLEKGDLRLMYKDIVDLYDRVSSGFANDIEDIQQMIFVLTNYGGESLSEFLGDLKRYKTIKVEDGGEGAKSGVSTLAIDIPVEARNSLLDRLRKDILVFGQGVDPDPNSLGDVSGVGIRHKYGLLELKAGAMETEFRPGVAQLVRLLLPDFPKNTPIRQTWTRNLIQNDLEQAQILGLLAGVTSQKTLDENNPLVDDAEEERKRREADEARLLAKQPEETPLFGDKTSGAEE